MYILQKSLVQKSYIHFFDISFESIPQNLHTSLLLLIFLHLF